MVLGRGHDADFGRPLSGRHFGLLNDGNWLVSDLRAPTGRAPGFNSVWSAIWRASKLDAEVAEGTFQLGVPKHQLHGAQVLRAAIDQFDQVTRPKLAVDGKVELRELSLTVAELQADTDCRDFSFSLNGAFWPTRLPLFQGSRAARSFATGSLVGSCCLRNNQFASTHGRSLTLQVSTAFAICWVKSRAQVPLRGWARTSMLARLMRSKFVRGRA
jgi:hypothetical protein